MIRTIFRRFTGALGFLTALPVTAQRPESLRGSVVFFPAVGLVLGSLLWLQFALLEPLLDSSLNALGLVLTGSFLTRGLHLDGLADSADGFLSHQSPERMLQIMRDSRIGTMGALALFFDLLIRWQALAHCPRSVISQALIVPPVLGRMGMGVGMVLFPYARDEGMASEFLPGIKKHDLIGLLLTGAIVAALAANVRGILVYAMALLGGFLLWTGCKRRLGGYTGDVLGATNEVIEVVSLILLVYAQ